MTTVHLADFKQNGAPVGVSVGGSPGGSDTQVQFNNAGSFGGNANLIWDNTAKMLSVYGPTDGVVLSVADAAASVLFYVQAVGTGPVVAFGDVDGNFNSTIVIVNDSVQLIRIIAAGAELAVDGANSKITANVKHITTKYIAVDDAAEGLILKDAAATPHYWRFKVSTLGVLTATDLGTSLP